MNLEAVVLLPPLILPRCQTLLSIIELFDGELVRRLPRLFLTAPVP